MAKTYEQIAKQIEALQQQAAALKQKEMAGVIGRIREAVAAYGLTPADLGFGKPATAAKQPGAPAGKRKTRRAKAGGKAAKRPSVIRYRSDNGQGWTGVGRKPNWVLAGLAAGKTLADFAVDREQQPG